MREESEDGRRKGGEEETFFWEMGDDQDVNAKLSELRCAEPFAAQGLVQAPPEAARRGKQGSTEGGAERRQLLALRGG